MGLVGGFIAAPCTGPFSPPCWRTSPRRATWSSAARRCSSTRSAWASCSGCSRRSRCPCPRAARGWSGPVDRRRPPASGRALLRAPARVAAADVRVAGAVVPRRRAGAVALGVALGGIKLSFHGPLAEKLRKGAGVALMVLGLFAAWDWYLTPKRSAVAPRRRRSRRARPAEGKGVMLDFGAEVVHPVRRSSS